ncbi:MAG TPA: TOBE domain-containing protein [Gaiellaceae bacterium]|nr:TOBE domain-containing protein [Gaiellaceae bacterium]
MRDGSIVQVGSPREIYDNPTSVFASTFIGESNLLFGTVTHADHALATVRIGHQSLAAPAERPIEPEASVALSIRPERIRLNAAVEQNGGWNRLKGTVEELIFLGNRIRARVSCGEATLWVEEPPTTPDADKLSEGSNVTLGWPHEDGRLITADEVGAAGR